MNQKLHEAQTEVWEWKEILYNELKNIPRLNWAKYLGELATNTIKQIELKKKNNNN